MSRALAFVAGAIFGAWLVRSTDPEPEPAPAPVKEERQRREEPVGRSYAHVPRMVID